LVYDKLKSKLDKEKEIEDGIDEKYKDNIKLKINDDEDYNEKPDLS